MCSDDFMSKGLNKIKQTKSLWKMFMEGPIVNAVRH